MLGTDAVPFEIDWSRYGFPGVTRSYDGFWAADEMARSRVYGGIHFSFDNAAGQKIGADVAGYVMGKFLSPKDVPASSSAGGTDVSKLDPLGPPAAAAAARAGAGSTFFDTMEGDDLLDR